MLDAGGLLNAYAELHQLDRPAVTTLVDHIGTTTALVLDAAGRHDTTPLAEARAQRLQGGTTAAVTPS